MKMLRPTLLALIAAMLTHGGATAATLWLPILATRANVSDALASADVLHGASDTLQLIATDDCGNLRQGLYVVSDGTHRQRQRAEAALNQWRGKGVQDAYLRACEVRLTSRLALGIPLLDSSFTRLNVEPINWSLDEAVSRVKPLNDSLLAVLVPRYEPNPEDIREGLRIGVRLYKERDSAWLDLSADCIDARFALGVGQLALTCVSEVAAANLLRTTRIFALSDGRLLVEEQRCAQPQYTGESWVCQKQSVNAGGVLESRSYRLRLP